MRRGQELRGFYTLLLNPADRGANVSQILLDSLSLSSAAQDPEACGVKTLASHPRALGVGQVTGDQKSGMTPTPDLNVTGVSANSF